MTEVESFYDHQYDEWERLDRHRVEFDITKRYLDEYLPGSGLSVFDIGGGPGRYSIDLAQKGHHIALLDLSGKNIEVAKEKAKEAGVELESYIHGDALKLDGFTREYDAVLLMGPLYHLIRADDRRDIVYKAW